MISLLRIRTQPGANPALKDCMTATYHIRPFAADDRSWRHESRWILRKNGEFRPRTGSTLATIIDDEDDEDDDDDGTFAGD